MKAIKRVLLFVGRPIINVQKIFHYLVLCFGQIIQTLTMLIMFFHVYALTGMSLFNLTYFEYPIENLPRVLEGLVNTILRTNTSRVGFYDFSNGQNYNLHGYSASHVYESRTTIQVVGVEDISEGMYCILTYECI